MQNTQKYRVDLPDGSAYEVEVPNTPQTAANELTSAAEGAVKSSVLGRALYRPFKYAEEVLTGIPQAISGVKQRGEQIKETFPEAPTGTSTGAAAFEALGNMIVGPAQAYEKRRAERAASGKPLSPIEQAVGMFESAPMFGPMITNYREKIEGGEGVEAAVDALMDIAGFVVGGGSAKQGMKLTAKHPVPTGAIPGAKQFAVEAPRGISGRIALSKATTPSGGELASQRIKARNPAIVRELERQGTAIGPVVDDIGARVQGAAQQGIQVADEAASLEALARAREFGGKAASREAVGDVIQEAVEERARRTKPGQDPNVLTGTVDELKPYEQRRTIPQKDINAPEGSAKLVPPTMQAGQATKMGKKPPKIGDIETKMWEPITEKGEGIGAVMSKTQEVVSPLKEASKDQILSASKLTSPKTQKIIKDLAEAKSDPNIVANQFLSMTDDQLQSLPGRLGEEARESMGMFRNLQRQGFTDREIMDSMSMFQRGEWQRFLDNPSAAVDVPQTKVFWKQLHEARQEIDGVLRGMGKDVLGTPEARVLRQIRDAMTEDLRTALQFDPDLVKQFDKANAFTRMRHEVYGEGHAAAMLKKKGGTPSSSIVDDVFNGTPEEARKLRQAIGNDPDVLAELRTGLTNELFERSKTTGASGQGSVNYAKAHELLNDSRIKEVMRETLGTSRYAKLLDDVKMKIPSKAQEAKAGTLKAAAGEAPERAVKSVFKPDNETAIRTVVDKLDNAGKQGFQRAAYDQLIKDSVPHHGYVDGPKLAKTYREHRSALEAAGVSKERLAELDAMFTELDKFKLTQGFDPTNPRSQIGALTETGAATKVGMSAVAGSAAGAAGGIMYLMVPRVMLRILLEPEGPKAFIRGLQAGKITGPLTKLVGNAMKAAGGMQAASVPVAAQERMKVSEEDEEKAREALKRNRMQ